MKTFKVTLGTKPDLTGINVSYCAKDMLGKVKYSKKKEVIDLVVISVKELGFKESATLREIYERAKELGYELCSAEVGPQLRAQYKDQPIGEWACIAMEPIRVSDGYLRVFGLGRAGNGVWLDSGDADSGSIWNPGNSFVFRSCKSELGHLKKSKTKKRLTINKAAEQMIKKWDRMLAGLELDAQCVKANYLQSGKIKLPGYETTTDQDQIRTFETGATRDADKDKIDPEGFISPIVIKRYCEYMKGHRVQADGRLRDSDNWQRGIPKDAYVKSLWRHFLDLWLEHRGSKSRDGAEDALCGLIFNAMGYLFEILKEKKK